jgi:hypothetical protein
VDEEKYRKLGQNASVAPLSELVAELLVLAQEDGHSEVAKWAALELGGYFRGNSALTEEVVVPEYRTVAGQLRPIRAPFCHNGQQIKFCE